MSDRRSLIAFLYVVALLSPAGSLRAQVEAYGVDATNHLIRFNTAVPGTILGTVAITGLQASETVLGIDFRPANGVLYGLGSTNRLYTINVSTGAATQVGSAGAFTLSGTEFGFDFNPVVNLIRVVSDIGQNIRLNPVTGTLAATDVNLNPGSPNVVASAYSNNYNGATSTTLYAIDSVADTLVIQNPPNNGTLNLVGSLGVDVTGGLGFDIRPYMNEAYAVMSTNATTSALYTINLATGAATLVGSIGVSGLVRGLAINDCNPDAGHPAVTPPAAVTLSQTLCM